MSIEFTPWPEAVARDYRLAGFWIDRPLCDVLDMQVKTRPNEIALICGERQWTYAEFGQRVDRLAGWLRGQGLQPHDTALVQLPNIAEFYCVFFALLRIGVVPLNALFSHQRIELCAYAKQLQPRLLIASRNHGLFRDEAFIGELATLSPVLDTVLLHGESTPPRSLDAVFSQNNMMCTAEQGSPTLPGEVAFFQLSGGSTGTPKLIPRTHNDYYYSVRRSNEVCQINHRTRYLCALPVAHNYPMSSPGALGIFDAGGSVVLAPSPEATVCFNLIERHAVTMTALVPTAVALWLQAVPGQLHRLRSLRLMQVGGAYFAEAVARRVSPELGCSLQQVFGMAEGLVNYTRLDDDDAHRYGTQGCPMSPADEVRVLDEHGLPVAFGETGMLATRGPYTFRGYYRSPEYNKRAFDAEGFYLSGDLVQQSQDGYLRVVGRVKDQINRGGEKIAAEEIEDLLLRHEAITHAGLVAMPDPLLGEKSCAFIVSRQADIKAAHLRRFLRELGVAEYKLPDRFQQIPVMPLTAVGKIDKLQLRAWLQASH